MKESTIGKTLILGFEKPDFCNSGIMPTLLSIGTCQGLTTLRAIIINGRSGFSREISTGNCTVSGHAIM